MTGVGEKRVVSRKFTQPFPPAPPLRAQARWFHLNDLAILALILFEHSARFLNQ